MKKYRNILTVLLFVILIAVLLLMFFPSMTIKIVVVILILISMTGELINVRIIKKKLKTGELKAISLTLTSSNHKIFWNIMLIIWFILACMTAFDDFKNLFIAILNIYICFSWLYFINLRRDYLFYNEKGISFQRLFEKFVPFESVFSFQFDGKRIILEKQKGSIRLPKFRKEVTEEVLELLNRNTVAQH